MCSDGFIVTWLIDGVMDRSCCKGVERAVLRVVLILQIVLHRELHGGQLNVRCTLQHHSSLA